MAALRERLEELLDLAVSSVATPPARQVIALAPLTIDCELLGVAFHELYRGSASGPTPDPRMCPPGRTLRADIILGRCVPTVTDAGQPPHPGEVSGATLDLLDEGNQIIVGLEQSDLFRKGDHVVGSLLHIPPSGGIGGVRIEVKVRII